MEMSLPKKKGNSQFHNFWVVICMSNQILYTFQHCVELLSCKPLFETCPINISTFFLKIKVSAENIINAVELEE